MSAEVTVERDGDHWTVRRLDTEWHYWTRAEADAEAERLRRLPHDARPQGWAPWGGDLLWDRED